MGDRRQIAEHGVTVADLDELRSFLGAGETVSSLQYFARYLRSSRAAETIVNSTARIFDLIGAVKDYSNMDRAPILEVDVPAGLDATLQMLRSRMDQCGDRARIRAGPAAHQRLRRRTEPGVDGAD